MTARARAKLTNGEIEYVFPFNPDEVSWDYSENIQSFDTLGGRVVQLLSVSINGLTVRGRAGSRSELLKMTSAIKDIMRFHIRTQRPVLFQVPSRKWNFSVYVQAMPQIGWEVSTVSYPYELRLAIEEDLAGFQSLQLYENALQRLARGIGYNPKVHGGDPSGFQDLVERILSATEAAQAGRRSNVRAGSRGGSGSSAGSPGAGGGSSTGDISSATPQLQRVLKALQKASLYMPGRICGSDTLSGSAVSEHYYCNAKDLMVYSNKELGDRIAAFLEHGLRSGDLPIHCIIWYRRILSRERLSEGWRLYTGTNPHTDHVHVSAWPSVGGAC